MSTNRQRLNLLETPLSGSSLIEASAGTGKTHTITGLFLRLVVESGLSVENILVVTYTRAATAELTERVRAQLVKALQAVEKGQTDDRFLRQLLGNCDHRDQAARRLTRAILGFDQSAIFTIHGFCQRVLSENAFESGMPFALELSPDQDSLLQEIVDDFWRCHFQDLPPGLADFVLDKGINPDALRSIVKGHLGKPYLQVRARVWPDDLDELESDFAQSFQRVSSTWAEEAEEIQALLVSHTGLNRNKYRPASLRNWYQLMDGYLGFRPGPWFKEFERFASNTLRCSLNKKATAPAHVFFDQCEALMAQREKLVDAYEQALIALEAQLLEHCTGELSDRIASRGQLSYDDLLLKLHDALLSERGFALRARVSAQFSAALVDEFQDTDPIQYRIFKELFGEVQAPVFFVGDPKQAIYSFRGADVFAYLKARGDAAKAYTLDLNWRSDAALIKGVNLLFDQSHNSFIYSHIRFSPAQAADASLDDFSEDTTAGAAFRIWLMQTTAGPLSKKDAQRQAAEATAAEIQRLLLLGAKGRVRIGTRDLAGGDIAVLVRTHLQGSLIRERLLERGINSVQRAQESVFRSFEAMELERVLLAIADPSHRGLVRAALSTDMLGLNGRELAALADDEQALEAQLESFLRYHDVWLHQGFIRLFRHLLADRKVAARLLRFPDGERRLTNLLHLGELLHQRDHGARPGIEGLIKWLARHRQSESLEDDETLLRLESDDNLVQIATIHSSKGLQYPIVFCPFLWDGASYTLKQGTSYTFHDPSLDFAPVLELGSARMERDRHYARQEELAENLRLAYVALTRAQHRTYMAWGQVNDAGQSALAWLLHPPPDTENGDVVGETAKRFKGLSDQDLRARVEQLVEAGGGALSVEPLILEEGKALVPPVEQLPALSARTLNRTLESHNRVTSFSALASHQENVELPDYDAVPAPAEMEPVPTRSEPTVYTFPRGAQAGSCLHAILEELDFNASTRDDLERTVEEKLNRHGFSSDWVEVVAVTIERVLTTPLDDSGTLRLQTVQQEQRLSEMEFYYPVAQVKAESLRTLLLRHDFAPRGPLRQAVEQLDFGEVQGFMKGYIDLVFETDGRFYVVDYKSNWLGDTLQAYARARLSRVIAQETYFLQYTLYALAVHRYLEKRLADYDYERHFGGVFYLFLRGMDPKQGPTHGVYYHRPSAALITELDASFRAGDFAA